MTYCIRNMTLESLRKYVQCVLTNANVLKAWHVPWKVQNFKTVEKNSVSYLQCLWLHLQPCTINNHVPLTIFFQTSPVKCYCAFNSIGKCPVILIRASQGANFNPLLPNLKTAGKILEEQLIFITFTQILSSQMQTNTFQRILCSRPLNS